MRRATRAEGYEGRAAGMKAAEDGADEAWFKGAVRFVTAYCRKNEALFCDDLWAAGLEIPREARALGPVIMQVARDGIIERSGRYRPSAQSNMTPKPVWRSLVFQGKPQRWFYVKQRRDGKFVGKEPCKGEDGEWKIRWVKERRNAHRTPQRSEAFALRAALYGCRVVSYGILRFKVAAAKSTKVVVAAPAVTRPAKAPSSSPRPRVQRGEKNPQSKLSNAQTRAIRKETGPLSAIATKYGVNKSTISRIKNGVLRAGL